MDWWTPEWVSAIGTLLGGGAALTAVILGWVQAERWRNERVVLKRAEVAGDALEAASALVDAMRATFISHGVDGFGDAATDRYVGVIRERSERYRVDGAVDDLRRILRRADAYLHDRAAPLTELYTFCIKRRTDHLEMARAIKYGERVPAAVASLYAQAFGAAPTKELNALHASVIAGLRPIAHLRSALDRVDPIEFSPSYWATLSAFDPGYARQPTQAAGATGDAGPAAAAEEAASPRVRVNDSAPEEQASEDDARPVHTEAPATPPEADRGSG